MTTDELANEPWFIPGMEKEPRRVAVMKHLPDSKTEPTCHACPPEKGQRYVTAGFPRIAWCAGCGRRWGYMGSPLGVDPAMIGNVPWTDAECEEVDDAFEAAWKAAGSPDLRGAIEADLPAAIKSALDEASAAIVARRKTVKG